MINAINEGRNVLVPTFKSIEIPNCAILDNFRVDGFNPVVSVIAQIANFAESRINRCGRISQSAMDTYFSKLKSVSNTISTGDFVMSGIEAICSSQNTLKSARANVELVESVLDMVGKDKLVIPILSEYDMSWDIIQTITNTYNTPLVSIVFVGEYHELETLVAMSIGRRYNMHPDNAVPRACSYIHSKFEVMS